MWMFEAAQTLGSAPGTRRRVPVDQHPCPQLCYLQALADVASDENSTIIFRAPLELLWPFLKSGRDGANGRVNGRPENASPVVKDPSQSERITGVEATPAKAKGTVGSMPMPGASCDRRNHK